MYLPLTYLLSFPLFRHVAVSSKQVYAKNNWPEWSLPPPQRITIADNMDLPVPEGSSSSTSATLSGQKDIVKQSLMTEQGSNTPLAREDGHPNNAAAIIIVTGRLVYGENELVSRDDFNNTILKKLEVCRSYHAIFHS